MRERLRQLAPPLIGLVLFTAALEVLRTELDASTWSEISRDVVGTAPSRLALAIGLTIANYAVLTGYDFLAFAYIGRTISRARIAVASFLAYAIANNVGFAMLSGASVRYRFYTRWGVTPDELSRIVFSYAITFWLGLLLLGGISLARTPLPAELHVPVSGLIAPIGWCFAALAVAYVVASTGPWRVVRLGRFELPLASPRLAAGQLLVSSVDWALAGSVLYVLLPPGQIAFVTFLGAFLAAQLVGLISHVPGGVGVFEGLMVLLLKPYLSAGALLPALVTYRAVYYLLPLVVALVGLVADEIRQRRAQARRVGALLGRLTEILTPRLLAVFAFLAGLVLLLSGATPAAEGRLDMLDSVFPLGVIEVSHFLGSIVGVLLLVLSQGLARRLDAAFLLTAAALVVGIAVSLLKGADYEEATVLAIVLAALLRARPAFDRRAALFETRYSPGWAAALGAALAASVWLGFFAFKHVEYSNELWWQFELQGEASRFLRASVGASLVLLLLGVARLIGHAPHETAAPTPADIEDASRAVAAQRSTYPLLVYLRDKALLFDDDRRAFLMYAVQGRTWVALGDPIGPADRLGGLVRLFLERCDDFGGTPVFYQVQKENLHLYADYGLTFVKLGEEAVVDVTSFTLEGGAGSRYRQVIRRLERDGGTFRLVRPADVPALLPQLRAVSDDWLREKSGGEKGFSLGFFDDEYLARFPVGIVEFQSEIVAFANVWAGPGNVELSVDLMRYHRHAPKGVMEALFAHLLVWGKAEGYQRFVLGMAPLSGFETSPVAPLWNRLGAFLYEHGEPFYNFQGLRAYKEKFNPRWEPRYLAYPGGLKLARVMADVSALIAGGYRRIFLK